MSVKDNLFLESDVITEQPFIIPFEFSNKESLPKGKEPGENIIIKPATVRTWFRLKPLLVQIDKDDLNKLIVKSDSNVPDDELVEIISKYDDLLMDIVFIGIHNKKSYMPEWFCDVLKDNCTWKDIHVLLNAIIYRLGFQSFYKSITTLIGVSPMTEQEIIAAQKNLESWTSQQAHSDF